MLDGRLYRAAFVPLLLVVPIVAFSLTDRPGPLTSTLAPDAFEGARAFAELRSLAAEFPDRRPGSAGDATLAARVTQTLSGLGGAAGGGFMVRVRHVEAATVDGERTLTTIVAERPGSTGATPIVVLAHRDAAPPGGPRAGRAEAELSGTAVLLELARVFAHSETHRTIVLVSTSGGSGGDAGAADFVAHADGPFDAALVLGDLAGVRARRPFVVPFSSGPGSASIPLQRTVGDAIAHEVGVDPGSPSVTDQLAHLALPATVGEQGPLNAAGLPAVQMQVSGEAGPSPREAVSPTRLEAFGRAALSAIEALDVGPDISTRPDRGLVVARSVIPAWALRLLVGALLAPPLLVGVDGLARLRRRRLPGRRSPGRWTLWVLACAAPFFACAVLISALGRLGVVAAPGEPVLASAMASGGSDLAIVLAAALVLGLGWLVWPALVRRSLGLRVRPDSEVAGISVLLVLGAVAVVVWLFNPCTAALLVPALHLWLAPLALEPGRVGRGARRALALAAVALGLVPLALLLAFYAQRLGLGPGQALQGAVLLLAGGRVGLAAALLWSLALGCLAAAVLVALVGESPDLGGPVADADGAPVEITVRGPLSYAGPGSLGGTESALRR